MIFTFYSFKGGVGRSMAMANMAWELARRGLRVLAVDFDLEAPGLERYFQVPVADVHLSRGVIDLIESFKRSLTDNQGMAGGEFRQVERFIHAGIADFGRGRLDLMPAGRRATDEDKRAYALAVRTFDWQDFYFNWEGQAFFEWLRKRLVEGENPYDVVLADSRTGVTEMGGVCACQLADVVVMLSAPNHQNVEGTRELAADLRSEPVQRLRRGRRPLQIVVVPARVEQSAPQLLAVFEERFSQAFDQLRPDLHVQLGIRAVDLALPYVPQFAFEEQVTSERTQAESTLEPQYRKLCDALLVLCEDAASPALAEAARAAGARFRPREEGAETAAPPAVPVFDPTKRWAGVDAYLSCANDARAEVGKLLQRLESRTGPLRTELSHGDGFGSERDLPRSTQEVLRHARTVVLFADARGVRPWQRAEVALARSLIPAPALVQVLLPQAAADAFDVAFGSALADSDVIDLRRWEHEPGGLSLLADALTLRRSKASATTMQEAHAPESAAAADVTPFPGAAPYSEALAAHFFGRDAECEALSSMVRTQRRSMLIGQSGAGKTSLVLAGLFPKLRATKDCAELRYLDLREGAAQAVDELARFEALPQSSLLVLDHVDECEDAVLARLTLAWQSDAPARVLLVWREAPLAHAEQRALERWKAEGQRAQADPKHELHHRSDWGAAARGLFDNVPSYRRHGLAPLPPERLREAVELALARTGRRGEAGLIERVFADAGAGTTAATIQRAMAFLWEKQASGFLENRAYNQAEGVDGLIRAELMRERSPAGAVPQLLYRLLAFGPVHWARIVTPASMTGTAAAAALQLACEGLAVVRRTEFGAVIELAHLPRELRLARMPGCSDEIQPVIDDIVRAYNAWADGQPGDEADRHLRRPLHEGVDLRLSHGELAFARHRIAALRQTRRQVKLGFAVLGGMFLLVGGAFWWAKLEADQAAEQRDAANQRAQAIALGTGSAQLAVDAARAQLQVVAQQVTRGPTVAATPPGARLKLKVYTAGATAGEEPAVRALLAGNLPVDRFEISPINQNAGKKVCGEVRFFSDGDAAAAKEVAEALNRATKARGDLRTLELADRRGAPAGDGPTRGTLEVWLPPQAVPGLQPARWGESRFVQGGCATVGSDQQGRDTLRKGLGAPDIDWYASELAVARPWVEAFYIGRTEVTAGAFAEYQRACEQQRGGDCPPWKPRFLDPQREARRPATFVSWNQARDYCAWAGGRLPSDLEWEKAARGPEGRFWPWGFDADDRLFQGRTRNPRAPVAVGSFSPQGDSPYGVADMAGNVWEYTADTWQPGQAGHTIRGGSYLNTLMETRSSVRWSSAREETGVEYLGFRCVMDIRH